MKNFTLGPLTLGLLVLAGCSDKHSPQTEETSGKAQGDSSTALHADAQSENTHPSYSLSVTPAGNSTPVGARLPNLAQGPNGPLLSWIEPRPSENTSASELPGVSLVYAEYVESKWSASRSVARGNDWFINWADFPAVYWHPEAGFAAHWLKKSSANTYSYDVMIASSIDGLIWQSQGAVHADQTPTEHGFASWFNWQNHNALVWLDGRNTATQKKAQPEEGPTNHEGGEHHSAAAGPMTLRFAPIDGRFDETSQEQSQRLITSTELDDRVCDCCQTAAVNTSEGALVFYRDRSDDEIRDITYRRYSSDQNTWLPAQSLHNDNWKISGCPVNGPQADALNDHVAVAWFTAAASSAKVMFATSSNAGEDFASPVPLGLDATQGRVDVVMLTEQLALVSWLRQKNEDQSTIIVSVFDLAQRHLGDIEVGQVSASRRSGFPRMTRISEQRALIAWSSENDTGEATIETAVVRVAGGAR